MIRRMIVPFVALLFLVAALAGCGQDELSVEPITAPEVITPELQDAGLDAVWQARIAAHARQHQERFARFTGELRQHGQWGDGEPIPIPGGLGPDLHIWLPGPIDLGFQGTDVEPSTITDFLGFSAIAFLAGEVTGTDGITYDAFHDMRVISGLYRDEDGGLNQGTFAFI